MNKNTEEMLHEIGTLTKNGDGERDELEALRREKTIRENLALELEEFHKLFPETGVDDIPDEVWEKCPDGYGLCAWFALYLMKSDSEKKSAQQKNEENSTSAVPDIKAEAEENYFSPEDVLQMSEKEVEKNYETILNSMKKWK